MSQRGICHVAMSKTACCYEQNGMLLVVKRHVAKNAFMPQA